MGMFIVSKLHIDYMVTEIIHAELCAKTPDEIGRMLWRENLASAMARYPNDKDGDRPGPIGFRDSDVDTYTWTETPSLSGPALAKTLDCYDYQSCEHPGWRHSEAYRITSKLREAQGDVPDDDPDTPWGWD